ncbi:hypothetical protein GGR50DRAFT_364907 [Xylaria sp. CBS 124048]|nr:hypothetical protein GGR50DRAFT_364907 [Xylaria sp. CBS 124048]
MDPANTSPTVNENGTSSKRADAPTDTPANATADASMTRPVKRGRGRPPKNGIAPQPKKAPSGRPRGRPPGSGTGVKKARKANKPAASTGTKRRGRPPKVKDVPTSENALAAAGASSMGQNNADDSAMTERKPQESEATEEPDADNEDVDAEADATADADFAMDNGAEGPPIDGGMNLNVEDNAAARTLAA